MPRWIAVKETCERRGLSPSAPRPAPSSNVAQPVQPDLREALAGRAPVSRNTN